MAPHALSALFALVAASVVVAQDASVSGLTWAPTPLVSQFFPTPTDAPEKVWPDEPAYARGIQTGYNRCNSTTEGTSSMCQTMYFNGLDDFCLWGPPQPNSTIADTEGEEVAWCTKKGYGTRIMQEGTILGAQLLKSNDYWMITGLLDQTKLNIQDGDYGGELDSGSQDGRGNPIGGLVYSTAYSPSVHQISWWTEFIGSNMFCLKICNPTGSNEAGYCQHTLDRIGLGYNCPSKYTVGAGFQAGDFEVCDTDDMGIPGVYTDSTGATQSYSQPAESLGPITTIPYQPTTVASRNCVKSASSALFTELVAATTTGSNLPTGSAVAAPSGGASGAGSGTPAKATGTANSGPSGSAGAGSPSGSAAKPSGSSAAAPVAVVGTAFSIVAAGAAVIAFL